MDPRDPVAFLWRPVPVAPALVLALAGLTLCAFGAAVGASFSGYDDPFHVTDNAHVRAGLTWAGTCWALTAQDGNWHPLTWMSLQLDATLWGLWPGGFHLTNVLLHVSSVSLLYSALAAMTAAPWRSGLAAALFALHPLTVESVAWVSERKGVLCGFFLALGLFAYGRYARKPSALNYLSLLGAFGLALTAKAAAVTFPCILLLLDYWPLRRLTRRPAEAPELLGEARAPSAGSVALEKLPLLAAAGLAGFAALAAERNVRALNTLGLPLSERLASVPVTYVRYLAAVLWPTRLAPFYPSRTGTWTAAQVVGAALLLGLLTAAALGQARRRPYLIVGWLWFVAALAPMSGILPISYHDIADRYAYVPLFGLSLAAAWVVAAMPRRAAVTAAAAALAACLMATRTQVGYWQDNQTLWRHAIEAVPDSYLAYDHIGLEQAMHGQLGEAIANLQTALRLNPRSETAHNNLGMALAQQGRVPEAAAHFAEAVRLDPSFVAARINLATALARQGRWRDAVAEYRRAVDDAPESADARYGLGWSLTHRGLLEDGMVHLVKAVRLRPEFAAAHNELGLAKAQRGADAEAVRSFVRAAILEPGVASYQFNLAHGLQRCGDGRAARERYARAHDLDPRLTANASANAWRLATDPDEQQRNGRLAVWLAEAACEATENRSAECLDALAAAYAEAGRFDAAADAVRRALRLTEAAGRDATVLRQRLGRYEKKRPHRETGAAATPPGAVAGP